MPDLLTDIALFHSTFEVLPEKDEPHELNPELQEFRIKFMQEELDEYIKACEHGDLEGQFDALIDLAYVVLGTAFLQALPFAEGWFRVHQANMRKVRARSDSESKRGTSYDIIKPEGWQPPVLADLIRKEAENDAPES